MLAAANWGISYDVKGDPKNRLARHLIDSSMVPDLLILDRHDMATSLANQDPSNVSSETATWLSLHPYMRHYRHGIVQPAIAIVRRDGSIPYRMSVNKMNRKNGYGAADRPNVGQVWAAFQALDPHDHTATVDDTDFRRDHLLDQDFYQVVSLQP